MRIINYCVQIFSLVLFWCATIIAHWAPDLEFPPSYHFHAPSESCIFQSGERGVYRNVNDCPETFSLNLYKKYSYIRNRPVSCHFPQICCPLRGSTKAINQKDTKVFKTPNYNGLTAAAVSEFLFECGISPTAAHHQRKKRWVVGGEETSVGQYPWMALVGKNESEQLQWICDGVLIHPQWVVSAAHCFLDPSSYVIRLGEHDINDPNDGPRTQDVEVSEVIFHPEFKVDVGYHDLVLLQLHTPIKLQKDIKPVCLPWKETGRLDGKKAIVAGWGAIMFGDSMSDVLRHAALTLFNASVCDAGYSKLPTYNTVWPQGITGKYTICAGAMNGEVDSCQGDSGGPLVMKANDERYYLVGITSKGFGCGLQEFPGLYVSVANYLHWIVAEIGSKAKTEINFNDML